MAHFFAVSVGFAVVHLADGAPGGLRRPLQAADADARFRHKVGGLVSCSIVSPAAKVLAMRVAKETPPRQWDITEELAGGAHGRVFKATSAPPSGAPEEVVIKISNAQIEQGGNEYDPDDFLNEADWYRYFADQEVRMVPTFKFVGRLNDNVVLITEYGGPDMFGEVESKESKILNLCQTLHFGAQGLQMLHELHSRHIIHRDIKVDNLLWFTPPGEDNFLKGELRVMDFGFARTTTGFSETDEEPAAEGTLVFLSWRRALGKAASYHDDLFSMALTILDLRGVYTEYLKDARSKYKPNEYMARDNQFLGQLQRSKVEPLLIELYELAFSGLNFGQIPLYDPLIRKWKSKAKEICQ